jgi:hypothetical protein
MAMTEEQYQKVSEYLLQQGQQELNGHLDGLWQELNELRKNAPNNQESRQTTQDFQDDAAKEPEENSSSDSEK